MPKISVILPIYKVEPYLDRCVDVLLRQTHTDLELILVDDGSPDRCGALCDAWAEKDGRVRVYHKENGGLSDARNYGIDRATGEYLSFVDPDDTVTEHYLSYLLRLMQEKEGTLLSACNHNVVRGDRKKANNALSAPRILSRKEAFEEVLYHGDLDVSAWGKLYHKSLFQTLRFPKGRLYEDSFVFGEVLSMLSHVVVGPEAHYDYIQREGSIVSGSFSEKRLQFIDSVSRLCDYALSCSASLQPAVLRRMTHARLSVLRYMSGCDRAFYPLRARLRDEILAVADSVLSDPRTPKRDRIAISTLRMGFPLFFAAWRLYGAFR